MDTMRLIPLSQVTPDPNQPRKQFTGVAELAKNMQLEGQIHPIEVDSAYTIIVGERRFRAATMLGWQTIKAVVHTHVLTPYERLRRQMSENIHQSAAINGDTMNPLDTARGWAHLYELKTGQTYQPGKHMAFGSTLKGPLAEIAEELGAQKETIAQVLQLLEEDEQVQRALERGLPRTYIREANYAPEQLRSTIKEKILRGEYLSREEIRQDVTIAKIKPELAVLSLERNRKRASEKTNRVLTGVVDLAIALERQPPEAVNSQERGIVAKQLQWLHKELERYLYGTR